MTQLFEPIVGGLTVLIIFLGLSSPIIIIGLVYYLKKRLEHKQIMAAIEKGTPLSELRPLKPKGLLWIRSLTAGIAFLVISLPFLYMFFAPLFRGDYSKGGFAADAPYPLKCKTKTNLRTKTIPQKIKNQPEKLDSYAGIETKKLFLSKYYSPIPIFSSLFAIW